MASASTSGWPEGSARATSSSATSCPAPWLTRDARRVRAAALRVRDRGSKPASRSITARHSAMRPIDVDEERQRGLHAVEGGRGLHQRRRAGWAGEIGRAHHDEGKDDRGLAVAGGEEGELLVARHDLEPVADHAAEAVHQPAASRRASPLQQRDLLGILAHAHQVEAEIRLVALLVEVERDQRPADQMGEQRADDRIDERRPDQIARDVPVDAEERQRRRRRQAPQDDRRRSRATRSSRAGRRRRSARSR